MVRMRIQFGGGRTFVCGLFAFVLVLLWSGMLGGCASYSHNIQAPRADFERGAYDEAIAKLQLLAGKEDNDQLLYLMDLGIVYHTAGRYADAIEAFRKADKIAEIKDYTSISEETLGFLLNEDHVAYKGELFEKLLINVYLAIDYTMLGKWEDALVECRQVNHKIDLMVAKGKLPYEHNSFAKYLAAVLFETQKEFNDALVDYRTVLKWKQGYPYLPTPLLRLTDRLKMQQEFEEFRKAYPNEKNFRIGKGEGEVILLVEQGKSPIKVPSEQFRSVPRFQYRSYGSDHVRLRAGEKVVDSVPLYDIEDVAIKELDSRIALIAAKKVAGIVAKEVIANQVEKQTKSPLAGALTRIFFYAQEKADLRSWSTLPARLHLARVVLPAGRHRISLDMVSRTGSDTTGIKVWDNVEVKAGQKIFLNYRTPD